MSTLLASCWALSLAGNSGEGARKKVILDTNCGFCWRKRSIPAWVNWRLPATSMMLRATGAEGCGRPWVSPREGLRADKPKAPPIRPRREMLLDIAAPPDRHRLGGIAIGRAPRWCSAASSLDPSRNNATPGQRVNRIGITALTRSNEASTAETVIVEK